MIYSQVVTFDSIPQEQIHVRTKNWAGRTFRNMNKVLVSETNEQMVFNYITGGFYTKFLGVKESWDWYVKMVVKIKDNKMKIMLYDDGNTFKAGTYTQYGSIPAKSAHTYHFYDYFKIKKDSNSMPKYTDALISFKNECLLTVESLVEAIKSPSNKNEKINDTSDNW